MRGGWHDAGMGLFRKMTSVGTMGLVDFRSDKERTARYTKQTRNAARHGNKQARREAERAKRHDLPPVPMVSQAPTVPPGMPPAQWNGTVWQAWNPTGNRWMVWNGQGWQ